jgi:pimeloyl-ACP methyl ester carboxylesterase
VGWCPPGPAAPFPAGPSIFWDPQVLDLLAADHDVIVFDKLGIGYSTGEPRDSVEEFADSAIEFIEALGLSRADLLG